MRGGKSLTDQFRKLIFGLSLILALVALDVTATIHIALECYQSFSRFRIRSRF